jgi:acetyl esterase
MLVPLHPDAEAYLRVAAAEPPVYTLTPAEARAFRAARVAATPRNPEPVGRVDTLTIPGPNGPIGLRVYRPDASGPHPVMVYFHGGGFVVGNLDQVDSVARMMTNAVPAVVVSVDYHLAPEHPFPEPVEDAYAALAWAGAEATRFGGDPDRLVVAGDSAGGTLAIVSAYAAADRGGPPVRAAVLVYPVCQYRFDTPSYQSFAEGYGLTRAAMQWYWKQYLRRPEDGRHPYAAPLERENLVGFPPALVILAEYDPLRDEGEQFAARLRQAGVPVSVWRAPGMVHGFFSQEWAPESRREAVRRVAAHLQDVLGRTR